MAYATLYITDDDGRTTVQHYSEVTIITKPRDNAYAAMDRHLGIPTETATTIIGHGRPMRAHADTSAEAYALVNAHQCERGVALAKRLRKAERDLSSLRHRVRELANTTHAEEDED